VSATQRPFRFGVVTSHVQSQADWVARVRKAEDLGYSTLLTVDHITTSLGPLVALAVAAQATTRIRLGTFVLCNDFRHPAFVAKELATLDVLSQGRFEFGLGAGYLPTDYQQSGVPLESAGVRLERFEEAIGLYKRLFQEETVHFQGKYYTVNGAQGQPGPVQKPFPPFYIGGGGKRVLSFAAREASIVGIAHKSSAHGMDLASTTGEPTAQKIAWVREAAGERFEQLELSVMVFRTILTNQREMVAQQIGSRFGLLAEQALDSMQLLVGNVDQLAETLWQRRERYGISYIVVLEESLDAFAPVVALLAGR